MIVTIPSFIRNKYSKQQIVQQHAPNINVDFSEILNCTSDVFN